LSEESVRRKKRM